MKVHGVYVFKMLNKAGLKNSSGPFKIFWNLKTSLHWVNVINSELSSS